MPYRSKPRHLIAPLIVALVLLLVAGGVVTWWPLRQARDDWRAGHVAQAVATAQRWSQLHVWPGQYDQLLAAIELTSGDHVAAAPYLNPLAGRKLWLSVVPKEEVARRLFARGDYAGFLLYDAASHEAREAPDVALYRAAALTATNRIPEAEGTFRAIDRSKVDAAKVAALEQALAQRRQGSYPLFFDRDGHAIASYQIGNGDLVAVDRSFQSIVEKEAGALTFESRLAQLGVNDTLDTTLDPFVQKAALQALGGFRGSLVAIDPRTNEILAIASNPDRGPLANLALEHQYEPGSVIKVLTGLNAISSGVDLGSMFPYTCKGELMIDGRHFGDWIPAGHGVLPAFDDALAESCNVVFADLGLRLGTERLRRFMTAAGFDGQTDLGAFQVPLGRTVGQIFNNFETAFYAIGLEHETINALHLAMIGSVVANRGVLTQPRLLRARRSILGESTPLGVPQGRTQLASAAAAEAVTRAMVAVTTRPRGTGRRVAIEGMTIALKTGTAGQRDQGGLQALIVGFAPADSPRIAFGMIAEDAGPAEYAGAKIVRDFLEIMKPRLAGPL